MQLHDAVSSIKQDAQKLYIYTIYIQKLEVRARQLDSTKWTQKNMDSNWTRTGLKKILMFSLTVRANHTVPPPQARVGPYAHGSSHSHASSIRIIPPLTVPSGQTAHVKVYRVSQTEKLALFDLM